ncbi:methyl-accepting chemotaxis protein [Fontibacillus panacisegetis]|uniref:Methyl-accepting chemotaxis protein n=1 Tax=Fontibacillus panacisegetis TaxID=670482 RepID=A0A1G7IR17_9BACL|nr:methyl-accepting chemotaxis protein [Fontibacillus panacisegetis]SDF15008.1 methyl-accepting chemotaxis protein [Fontibacillus panacisegetis]
MRRSVGTKIGMIVIGMMIVFAAAIAVVAIEQMEQGIKTFAEEKAKSDLELASQFIDSKYAGDWLIQDGELYKGSLKINGNFDLVDEIGEMTGDTVTIFQGNTRVATNVMNEGERAVGTTVSGKVEKTVLKSGQKYYGEAVVVGHTYQAAYEPIIGADGQIIGIFYVGASQSLINEITSSFISWFFVVIVIAIVVAIVLIVWYIGRMKNRLRTLTKAMERAGEGDFTTTIDGLGKDEIGELAYSFNRMGENLKELVQHGLHASGKVTTATDQLGEIAKKTTEESSRIVNSIEQVAKGADSQTQSTAENAKAVEEIAFGIQSIAEHAVDVSEEMGLAQQHALVGNGYVKKTVQQMHIIDRSVRNTEFMIRQLDEKSQEITEMLGMIQNIAQQTGLLALNASIEAARAGEDGRGFAVVASEVRKLADQTNQVSETIGNLLGDINSNTKSSIRAMTEATQEVQLGLELTNKTEESFDEIVESSTQIAEQMEQLAATAEQMSAGIEQITASVTMISEIAQAASASSRQVASATTSQQGAIEEINSASSSLHEVSNELKLALGKFKIIS